MKMKKLLLNLVKLILILNGTCCFLLGGTLISLKSVVFIDTGQWIEIHLSIFEIIIPEFIRNAFHFYDEPLWWLIFGILQYVIYKKIESIETNSEIAKARQQRHT